MTEKVIVDMELFSDNNKYCRCWLEAIIKLSMIYKFEFSLTWVGAWTASQIDRVVIGHMDRGMEQLFAR